MRDKATKQTIVVNALKDGATIRQLARKARCSWQHVYRLIAELRETYGRRVVRDGRKFYLI